MHLLVEHHRAGNKILERPQLATCEHVLRTAKRHHVSCKHSPSHQRPGMVHAIVLFRNPLSSVPRIAGDPLWRMDTCREEKEK
jgi:hypothetical protein